MTTKKTGFDKYIEVKMRDPYFANGYQRALAEINEHDLIKNTAYVAGYKKAYEEVSGDTDRPSWANTIRGNFRFWNHMEDFVRAVVIPSGYPYFLWNEKVYKNMGEYATDLPYHSTDYTIDHLNGVK